jgi:hypothetical protein
VADGGGGVVRVSSPHRSTTCPPGPTARHTF